MEEKKKSVTYAQQVFYTSSLALQIQISSNGIFFEIAPAIPKTDRYDWKQKIGVKFSVSEISNFAYAMEELRTAGEAGYIKASKMICGEAYNNVQFVHKNRKQEDVRTGLNLYNNRLQFVISNKVQKVDLKFPILNTEKIRFEKFLNFIVNTAFAKGV